MINIGDTVKVIGATVDGDGKEKELIHVGTVCSVLNVVDDEQDGPLVEIVPYFNRDCQSYGYWYSIKDVEKGHMEWVKEEDNSAELNVKYQRMEK